MWGGFFVLQHTRGPVPVRDARLRLELVRSETDGHLARGLTAVRGRLCTRPFGPFALCAEAEVLTANATFTSPDSAGRIVSARETATTFGLTLGLGGISAK